MKSCFTLNQIRVWNRVDRPQKQLLELKLATITDTPLSGVSPAGDSFSQFRFSEEKDWGVDSFAINEVNL